MVAETLGFWFEECLPEAWFKKDEAFDAACRTRFLERHAEVASLSDDACLADARTALAALELACETVGDRPVSLRHAEDALQRRALRYDKEGDQHYDTISAWIKATRGSDPDATLLYLATMLEGGEDPRFIARRMVILASEDIGNADPRALEVAVAAAHAHHLKVAAHALSNESASRAAAAGVDVLAHTPVEPLADATIEAWRGRAVISTLAAFGGSEIAIDNLRKLRNAGCTVLYGTDLGNLRDAGPSAAEMLLLGRAGLDDEAVTAAMTTVPAMFWGLR